MNQGQTTKQGTIIERLQELEKQASTIEENLHTIANSVIGPRPCGISNDKQPLPPCLDSLVSSLRANLTRIGDLVGEVSVAIGSSLLREPKSDSRRIG